MQRNKALQPFASYTEGFGVFFSVVFSCFGLVCSFMPPLLSFRMEMVVVTVCTGIVYVFLFYSFILSGLTAILLESEERFWTLKQFCYYYRLQKHLKLDRSCIGKCLWALGLEFGWGLFPICSCVWTLGSQRCHCFGKLWNLYKKWLNGKGVGLSGYSLLYSKPISCWVLTYCDLNKHILYGTIYVMLQSMLHESRFWPAATWTSNFMLLPPQPEPLPFLFLLLHYSPYPQTVSGNNSFGP